MGLFRNRVPYVDPLTEAHESLSSALAIFTDASNNLAAAITQYEGVQDDAAASIARAEARHTEAEDARQKSLAILNKIEALTA